MKNYKVILYVDYNSGMLYDVLAVLNNKLFENIDIEQRKLYSKKLIKEINQRYKLNIEFINYKYFENNIYNKDAIFILVHNKDYKKIKNYIKKKYSNIFIKFFNKNNLLNSKEYLINLMLKFLINLERIYTF